MLSRLADWYSRRIVNVNVNVIAAGLLALLPVIACVHLTEWALSKGIVDGDRLHVSDKLIIAAVTFVSDIIFDVAIYYGLHWLANHAPWIKAQRAKQLEAVADAAVESSPFFKDATKVQLQRALLSPLLYILWIGMQQFLMHRYDFSSAWATVAGFCAGVGVARALHTYWMIQEDRRRRAAIAAGKIAPAAPVIVPPEPHPIWERPKTAAAGEFKRTSPSAQTQTNATPAATNPPNTPDQSLSENGVKSVARSK